MLEQRVELETINLIINNNNNKSTIWPLSQLFDNTILYLFTQLIVTEQQPYVKLCAMH